MRLTSVTAADSETTATTLPITANVIFVMIDYKLLGRWCFNVTGNKAGNTTIKKKKVYVLENCPKDLVGLVKLRREST